ncbi:MAG: hypothetical protein H7A23_09140 [Leptospiraceae bacterium]|nr:hypothetical protein [Leptospiraceae bacterium]
MLFRAIVLFSFLIFTNLWSQDLSQYNGNIVIPERTERILKEPPDSSKKPKKSKYKHQGVFREREKYQISFSQFFISLSLQYNWSSKVSMATSIFYKDGFQEHKEYENYGEFIEVYNLKRRYSLRMLQANIKVFPFAKFPIYLTGGIGRNFVGQFRKQGKLGSFEPSTNIYTQDYSPIVVEDINALTFLDSGIGFQWIFGNGLFLGVEWHKYHPYKIKHNIHFYMVDDNSSLTNYFLQKEFNQYITVLDSPKLPEILLWIGYAF